jgi:hypothetical protein
MVSPLQTAEDEEELLAPAPALPPGVLVLATCEPDADDQPTPHLPLPSVTVSRAVTNPSPFGLRLAAATAAPVPAHLLAETQDEEDDTVPHPFVAPPHAVSASSPTSTSHADGGRGVSSPPRVLTSPVSQTPPTSQSLGVRPAPCLGGVTTVTASFPFVSTSSPVGATAIPRVSFAPHTTAAAAAVEAPMTTTSLSEHSVGNLHRPVKVETPAGSATPVASGGPSHAASAVIEPSSLAKSDVGPLHTSGTEDTTTETERLESPAPFQHGTRILLICFLLFLFFYFFISYFENLHLFSYPKG